MTVAGNLQQETSTTPEALGLYLDPRVAERNLIASSDWSITDHFAVIHNSPQPESWRTLVEL